MTPDEYKQSIHNSCQSGCDLMDLANEAEEGYIKSGRASAGTVTYVDSFGVRIQNWLGVYNKNQLHLVCMTAAEPI